MTLTPGEKLVNLTTGWSGYIDDETCEAPYDGGGNTCVSLDAFDHDDLTALGTGIDITAERFRDGDAVAVFVHSDLYVCDEARVDIRDNVIHDTNAWDCFQADGSCDLDDFDIVWGDGIYAYSVSVWVDGNNVYSNDGDGFSGDMLACSGGVIVCDGMDRSDKLLELSNNTFEMNGLVTRDDWTDADAWGNECFLPEPGGDDPDFYNHAGVKIDQVVMGDSGEMDALYIHDNDILSNWATGLWLEADSAYCGIRVLRNDIETNEVFGVSSWAINSALNASDMGENGKTWFQPTSHTEVDVIFKYNDVVGNGLWGVKNWAYDYSDWGELNNQMQGEGGPLFNAKENYWNYCEGGAPPGSRSPMQESCTPGGPSAGPQPCAHDYDQRGHGLGYGDAVDKGTFYNPWLAVNWEALLDVETQGMRAYGSDSLQLQAGWNTLAVPIAVDDNYDEVAEILALGTFLDADVDGDGTEEELVERLYEFDNTGMGWQQNPELASLHGYYIKINPDLAPEGTKFPVIYNVERGSGLPSYDLLNNDTTGGWNLIGSGFGIDRDWDETCYLSDPCPDCQPVSFCLDPDDDQGRYAIAVPYSMDTANGNECDGEAVKWAGEVLESVVWGDNFSYGASLVVNPGVPGQLDPFWARTVQNIYNAAGADPAYMYTGEAYWVFMREDGTLAGFEMTPLYLDYEPFPIPLW